MRTARGRLWIYAVASAAVLVVAATGCGGGNGDGTTGASEGTTADTGSSERAVDETLELVFTTAEPDQCTDGFTLRALYQLSPGLRLEDDPIAVCRKNIDPGASAKSIKVTDLEVDGDHATATVTPAGGGFAGARLEVSLVDSDGWKLDRIDRMKILDRDEYLATTKAQIAQFTGKFVSGSGTRCLVSYVRTHATNEDLEDYYVTGDRGYAFDAIRKCLGAGTDTLAIVDIVTTQLEAAGLSKKQAACITGFALPALKGATLEEFATDPAFKERFQAAILKATKTVCAG